MAKAAAPKKEAGEKAAKEKVAKEVAGKKKDGTPARVDGIHKPVIPSPELAAVVGEGAKPRSEIISKLWEHIKANDLQDPKDKRQINADEKLEKVFGKKSVSMFEMNKHVSAHVK